VNNLQSLLTSLCKVDLIRSYRSLAAADEIYTYNHIS